VSGPPLARKVVVVTGATSGIGRATALACSRQGARLMAVGRKGAALESLAEACAGWGGELRSIALDVTEDEAMETIASDALDAFGRIDAWVNNAAVYAVGRFEQTPPEAFERVLAVNLQAAVRGSRVALAQFRAQGEGVLINVSSMVAGLPGPTVSAYAAAKWGLRGFSLALHAELRDEPGIDVCVVRPSSIDTPIFRQTANYSGRRVKALTPTYAPEEAARAIAGLITKPRRELVVGRSGKALVAARHLAPGLVDRIFATRSVRDQFDGDEPAELTDGNLYEPDERWDGVTGGWRERGGAIAAGARAGQR
jgi:short-subunit dehydrogenase